MGRHSLRIIMVLGALVTLVGGTGVFAVFSDRATAGTNTASSGARPHAADLQINAGHDNGQVIDCNQDPDLDGLIWEEDLAQGQFGASTGQMSLANLQPGSQSGPSYLCLLNAGAAPLALTATVIDLVDTETACSGDEAAAGDTTCGIVDPFGLPYAGELSPVLMASITVVDCTAVGPGVYPVLSQDTASLAGFTNRPVGVAGTLVAPGAVTCLDVSIEYPSSTPEGSVQVAQSDLVTWRFAFDGTSQ